jgi:lipoprotein NlpD
MYTLRAMQKNDENVRLSVAQRVICAVALSALAACATRLDPAPVVDRSSTLGTQSAGAVPPQGSQPVAEAAAPLAPPPPGYHRVAPGENLYRIALENGQSYRDLAVWNNLADVNRIEVGQLLRVVPPGSNAAAAPGVALAPTANGGAVRPPAANAGGAAGASGAAAQNGAAQPPVYGTNWSNGQGASAPAASPANAPAASVPAAANLAFAWPARGPVVGGFDDSKNKGINIGGTPGEAVKAAADGRVVYAGNGLRGYGNLIIIKHDATYLTAYAHNRSLMVKEGDSVTKGQKIAEMGNSDADRVMLHFEVRRQGKPVDPMKYLPPQ